MASSPRSREREAERRLNLQTLAIASAASATAAAVTSQLWIAGTWIAAAVTPVFVTLLSELLRRPTERIAQALTTDDAAVPDPAAPAPRDSPESRSVRGPGVERPPGPPPAHPVSPPDPDAPSAGAAGPVRVYRQPSRRPPRRKIAYGVVAATAGIAFVIGVVVFTTTELIAGESIGRSGNRTTLLGGNGKNKTSEPDERQAHDADRHRGAGSGSGGAAGNLDRGAAASGHRDNDCADHPGPSDHHGTGAHRGTAAWRRSAVRDDAGALVRRRAVRRERARLRRLRAAAPPAGPAPRGRRAGGGRASRRLPLPSFPSP